VPNYEYECLKEGNRFELWQAVGSPAPQCPTCGSDTKKVFHAPRVIFKGSGFYVTDLRAEKEKASGSSSSKSEGETKTETSAPAKTESAPTTPAPAASTPAPAASP
jgi:putative FmdB family regulatory protein